MNQIDHNSIVESCIIFKNIFPPYVLEHILSYITNDPNLIDTILQIVQRHPYKMRLKNWPIFKDCKELLPTEYFTTFYLNDDQQYKFDLLKSLVDLDWDLIFKEGLFIAGDAALFILDDKQCLENLGDIDIWVPNDKIQWLENYLNVFVNNYDREFVLENGNGNIIYFVTDQCYIQFLLLKKNNRWDSVEELLLRCDYEMNQCAISYHPTKGIIATTTPAFNEIMQTRKIKYYNTYKGSNLEYSECRQKYRVQKICNKGFSFGKKCCISHNCEKEKKDHTCLKSHHRFQNKINHFKMFGIKNKPNYILLLDSQDYRWNEYS